MIATNSEFRMRWRLVGSITLAAFLGTSAFAGDDVPIPGNRPECALNPNFTVADFSAPLLNLAADQGRSALEQLKAFKIDTVFRYYDHEDETLPGKTLFQPESDAIISAGLKIGVVFQHRNDDPAKFLAPDSGTRDAERALKLADENRQPYDSAIYFTVDGPERHLGPLIQEYDRNKGNPMSEDRKSELRQQKKSYFIVSYENFLRHGKEAFKLDKLNKVTPAMMKPVITRYFDAIRQTFLAYAQQHGGKGYKVGMYCTAAMCMLGDDRKLAEFFWISPEGRRDPEYRQFLQRSGHWILVQQLSSICPNWGLTPDHRRLEFDFNYVNPQKADFGQWGTKR
jgi:glycoside hydrolase-like protein